MSGSLQRFAQGVVRAVGRGWAPQRSPRSGEVVGSLRCQHELPAGAQDSPRFGQRPYRVSQVGQHPHQQGHVKAAVRKRQRFGVSCCNSQSGYRVHAYRPACVSAPRQCAQPVSGPCADVQHVQFGGEIQGVQQRLIRPALTAQAREQGVTGGGVGPGYACAPPGTMVSGDTPRRRRASFQRSSGATSHSSSGVSCSTHSQVPTRASSVSCPAAQPA